MPEKTDRLWLNEEEQCILDTGFMKEEKKASLIE